MKITSKLQSLSFSLRAGKPIEVVYYSNLSQCKCTFTGISLGSTINFEEYIVKNIAKHEAYNLAKWKFYDLQTTTQYSQLLPGQFGYDNVVVGKVLINDEINPKWETVVCPLKVTFTFRSFIGGPFPFQSNYVKDDYKMYSRYKVNLGDAAETGYRIDHLLNNAYKREDLLDDEMMAKEIEHSLRKDIRKNGELLNNEPRLALELLFLLKNRKNEKYLTVSQKIKRAYELAEKFKELPNKVSFID